MLSITITSDGGLSNGKNSVYHLPHKVKEIFEMSSTRIGVLCENEDVHTLSILRGRIQSHSSTLHSGVKIVSPVLYTTAGDNRDYPVAHLMINENNEYWVLQNDNRMNRVAGQLLRVDDILSIKNSVIVTQDHKLYRLVRSSTYSLVRYQCSTSIIDATPFNARSEVLILDGSHKLLVCDKYSVVNLSTYNSLVPEVRVSQFESSNIGVIQFSDDVTRYTVNNDYSIRGVPIVQE